MNSISKTPIPVCEPVKSYLPNSIETNLVKTEYSKLMNRVIDIPMYINGKNVKSKKTRNIYPPHNHKHLIGKYYLAENKFVSVNLSDIDTKSFSNGLIENIKEIEKTESEQSYVANESKLCNWCYYWKECPVKNGSSPSEYIK